MLAKKSKIKLSTILFAVSSLGLSASSFAAISPALDTADALVTYNGSVKAIFQKHCASCHGAGSSSGNLMDYQTAFNNRDLIAKAVTVDKSMPAGSVDITDLERAEIGQWVKDGALLGDEPLPTPTPSPTPVPSPTPTQVQPTIFALDCNYAISGKDPLTCTVQGSVCLDGSIKCVTAKQSINSQLSVSCSDGFYLQDTAATRAINGSILTMQGKDTSMNAAVIDFNSFDNKAGTLPSNLKLTYSSGAPKALAGSCILR